MDVDLKALSRSALEQSCALLQTHACVALEQVASKKAEITSKDAKILELETQIEHLTKILYGKKSEKKPVAEESGQHNFLEAAVFQVEPDAVSPEEQELDRAEEKQLIQYERKKNRAKREDKDLPERVIVLEPSPEDRMGPDGQAMVINGYHSSRKLNFIPERLEWLITKSPIMATADTKEYSHVVQTSACLVPGGKATDAFMLAVTLRKFGMGIPLYRQTQHYRSLGADLADNYLSECVRHVAGAFQPVVDAMIAQVFRHRWVLADETPIKQMKSQQPGTDGKTIRTSQMWACVAGKQAVFHYEQTRSKVAVRHIFGIPYDADDPHHGPNGDHDPGSWKHGGDIGFLVCDGYASYNPLFTHTSIARVACWIHARRRFLKYAQKDANARGIVRMINKLQKTDKRIRREADKRDVRKGSEAYHHFIAEARQQRHSQTMQELRAALDLLQPIYAPDTTLGPAITYINNRWDDLQHFLSHGFLPMTTNAVERAIRPIAVGRKNWLFVGSEDGGRWAATMFSIVESCRLQKLDLQDYCDHVLSVIVNAQDPAALDYQGLTPAAINKAWQEQLSTGQ